LAEREVTMKYIKEWSEKTGRSVDELLQRLEEFKKILREAHPGKSEEFYEARARLQVYRELKQQLRMPRAKQFDGIFLGYGIKMDVFAARREQALQIWKQDPKRAIDEGWCDAEGTPIFTMPSGSVIKIDKPVYLRQSVGVCRLSSGGDLKLFVMVHRLDQADKLPPLGKPVRFLANLVSDTPTRYELNTTRITQYADVDMPEFPKVDESTICDLLSKAPDELKATCAELPDWHTKHANDPRRIVILEADVIFIRREPTAFGNYIMVVEDETIMDLAGEGITVWLHEDLMKYIDFGAGSRVYVVGRTTTGPGWNPETRSIDPSVQRTMVNAFGIWPIPEFKVPPEEEVLGTVEDVE